MEEQNERDEEIKAVGFWLFSKKLIRILSHAGHWETVQGRAGWVQGYLLLLWQRWWGQHHLRGAGPGGTGISKKVLRHNFWYPLKCIRVLFIQVNYNKRSILNLPWSSLAGAWYQHTDFGGLQNASSQPFFAMIKNICSIQDNIISPKKRLDSDKLIEVKV